MLNSCQKKRAKSGGGSESCALFLSGSATLFHACVGKNRKNFALSRTFAFYRLLDKRGGRWEYFRGKSWYTWNWLPNWPVYQFSASQYLYNYSINIPFFTPPPQNKLRQRNSETLLFLFLGYVAFFFFLFLFSKVIGSQLFPCVACLVIESGGVVSFFVSDVENSREEFRRRWRPEKFGEKKSMKLEKEKLVFCSLCTLWQSWDEL